MGGVTAGLDEHFRTAAASLSPSGVTAGDPAELARLFEAQALSRHLDPDLLVMPLQPIAAPGLPVLAALGIMLAALPAFVTPPTPSSHRATAPVRRELSEVAR